ncbi:MAG: FAD-dependent oxidoreductase, partial [Phycisphaerales bacterium]
TTIPARGMQRIPEQIAAALPPGTLRTSTPIAAIERDGDTLILRTADNTPIRAHSVIIATDQTTAARLLNSLGIQPPGTNPGAPPAWRPTATIWFDAPASPTDNEPILVLDGDAQGPINHLMTLSDASRDYAPPGRHLVSASIIDEHALALDDQELLDRAIAQADRWFNNAASAWRTLRIDRIPQALPNQFAPRLEHPQRPVRVDGNIFACGDWLDNASINGAMESGRRAAALELSRRGIDPTRNAPTTDGADA